MFDLPTVRVKERRAYAAYTKRSDQIQSADEKTEPRQKIKSRPSRGNYAEIDEVSADATNPRCPRPNAPGQTRKSLRCLTASGIFLRLRARIASKSLPTERASDVIEHSSRGVQDVWAGDPANLRAIPGVGEAIADKLDELFRTGQMGYYEKIRQQIPEGLVDMLAIPGVGPKTVSKFWKEFKITTLEALKQALENPAKNLPGVGDKTLENLKQGISLIGAHTKRVQWQRQLILHKN